MGRAVDRWNAVAIEPFCLRDSPTPGEAEKSEHGVFRMVRGSDFWKKMVESTGLPNVLGVHRGSTDQIIIVGTDGDTDLFELIALHEFGHAHGLRHVGPPALLCSWVGSASDFTPNDMAECRRVGACEGDSGEAAEPADLEPGDQILVR
jgi:hypothetical protein